MNTYDYFHFYVSRDGGASFETRKGRLGTAFVRYLKTGDGLHFIEANSGGITKVTLDTDLDASPPVPAFRGNSMQWTDQAFPFSAMCTSNYLDVAADPKSPRANSGCGRPPMRGCGAIRCSPMATMSGPVTGATPIPPPAYGPAGIL